MNEIFVPQIPFSSPYIVSNGKDRFGDHRGLGISHIDFKAVARDNPNIFILENTFHRKGGPARHLHCDYDEWFYVLRG
jgi:hypothetical protein